MLEAPLRKVDAFAKAADDGPESLERRLVRARLREALFCARETGRERKKKVLSNLLSMRDLRVDIE